MTTLPSSILALAFFGYSCEVADPNNLDHWSIKICTSNLFKIGKGALLAGLIATCRSPKVIRLCAGGNEALQRLRRAQGIARGKDGITTMNSSCATISYVPTGLPCVGDSCGTTRSWQSSYRSPQIYEHLNTGSFNYNTWQLHSRPTRSSSTSSSCSSTSRICRAPQIPPRVFFVLPWPPS